MCARQYDCHCTSLEWRNGCLHALGTQLPQGFGNSLLVWETVKLLNNDGQKSCHGFQGGIPEK